MDEEVQKVLRACVEYLPDWFNDEQNKYWAEQYAEYEKDPPPPRPAKYASNRKAEYPSTSTSIKQHCGASTTSTTLSV